MLPVMRVILELEVEGGVTIEDIEEDIIKGADQIGWHYDYTIKSVRIPDEN